MQQNVCFKYILATANKVSITKMKTGTRGPPSLLYNGYWG